LRFFLAAFSLERARRVEGHPGQTEEESENNSWIGPHKLILSGPGLRRRMVIRVADLTEIGGRVLPSAFCPSTD
jgi:hypothetical protein